MSKGKFQDTDFGSDISWLFLLLNADEFNQNLWTLCRHMSLKYFFLKWCSLTCAVIYYLSSYPAGNWFFCFFSYVMWCLFLFSGKKSPLSSCQNYFWESNICWWKAVTWLVKRFMDFLRLNNILVIWRN